MLKMRAKNIGKAFIFFLLVLSLAETGNALSACQCSTVNYEFGFTNNGNSVRHYNIQKSGSASSWAVVAPMTFDLQPGESRVVVAFIKVGCDVKEGEYVLSLKAVSDDDIITKSVALDVSSCHSVVVKPLSSLYDGCINKEMIIPFNVSNKGDYVEKINLSSESGRLSIPSVILGKGDYQIVNLFYTPTKTGVNAAGITAMFGDEKAKAQASINVRECAFFNASLSDNYVNLCEDQEKTIYLTIQNGGKENTFFLNASEFFVDLPHTLTLGPNEKRRISITVYSGCQRKLVNSSLTIKATGAREIILPLVLNLRDCYLPIVVSHKLSDNACSCDNVSYDFTIYNAGNRAMTYSLSSTKGDIYLDGSKVNEVNIPPDSSVDLTLKYNVPCSYEGKMFLNITAASVATCKKESTAGVKLAVSSFGDCEAVKLAAPGVSILNNSLFVVPVSIMNVGVKPASYRIVVSGTAMSNLMGISRSFVTLNPGEKEVIDLTFDPSNITGSFLNVQAFSLDNLASDSTVINFNKYALTKKDIYYLLIPSSVAALIVGFALRSKFFKKKSIHKPDEN